MKEYTGRIAFRIFGVSAICLSFIHYFVQKFLDNFGTKHGKILTITTQTQQPQNEAHINIAFSLSDKNLKNTETFTPKIET